jgi:hypothetical protein
MLVVQLGTLIGQINRQPQAGGNNGLAGGMAGLACECGFGIIGLIIGIMYLLTLSKALAACAPRNRTMEPGMVWLNLIPLFNIVWIFITIIRISESLKNEFRDRGLRSDDPEFGKMTGITYAILCLIPCVNIVGLIFFIMYWVKIAGYKNQLISAGIGTGRHDDEDDDRPRRRRDEDDDDGDDRPRRRPRRDDDE